MIRRMIPQLEFVLLQTVLVNPSRPTLLSARPPQSKTCWFVLRCLLVVNINSTFHCYLGSKQMDALH